MTHPTPTAAPKSAPAAIRVPCIKCGEPDASFALNLAGLDAEDALHCHECEADFSLAEVREVIGRWTKLLVWIDSAPQMDADE